LGGEATIPSELNRGQLRSEQKEERLFGARL
jgi:hypothetical protein